MADKDVTISVNIAGFENTLTSLRTQVVLAEVGVERQRQISLGYDAKHDDAEGGAAHLVTEASDRFRFPDPDKSDRRELVEITAMLVAAIEAIDRAEREKNELDIPVSET